MNTHPISHIEAYIQDLLNAAETQGATDLKITITAEFTLKKPINHEIP